MKVSIYTSGYLSYLSVVFIATVGQDVLVIAKVLEDVKDWEVLASWLDVSDTIIAVACAASTTVAQCHRKMLVEAYCDKLQSGDPRKVVSDIAHVLKSEMGMLTLAVRLREFTFAEESEWIVWHLSLKCTINLIGMASTSTCTCCPLIANTLLFLSPTCSSIDKVITFVCVLGVFFILDKVSPYMYV